MKCGVTQDTRARDTIPNKSTISHVGAKITNIHLESKRLFEFRLVINFYFRQEGEGTVQSKHTIHRAFTWFEPQTIKKMRGYDH